MKTRKNITTKKLLIIAVGFMLLVATVFGILFGTYVNVNAEDRDPVIMERSAWFHRVNPGEQESMIERTVTDAGVDGNSDDLFNSSTQFINIGDIMDRGFHYISVILEFQMKEVNDGYQHIYLYSHSEEKAGVKLNYYGNTTKKEYNRVAIHFKTMFFTAFLNEHLNMELRLRYDASGAGADTWKYKDMLIRVQLSQVVLRNETVKYGQV